MASKVRKKEAKIYQSNLAVIKSNKKKHLFSEKEAIYEEEEKNEWYDESVRQVTKK